MPLYINYTIKGVDYQTGAYPTSDAGAHKRDISSFAGVEGVFVTTDRDESRTYVGSSAER